MFQRLRQRRVLGLCALAVGVLTVGMLLRDREPAYHGRRLSKWLEDTDNGSVIETIPETQPVVSDAIRAAGTNAIPILFRMLQAEDSPARKKVGEWLAGHHLIIAHCFTPAAQLNTRAVFGFCALGTNARPALSALIDLHVERGNYRTAQVLANIGPDAVLALSQLLTNRNISVTNYSRGINLRIETIWALANLDLARRNTNSGPERLAILEQGIKAAVPFLSQCLADQNVGVRALAAHALLCLDGAREEVVSVLAEAVSNLNVDSSVRRLAAGDLVRIGPSAASAVPTLLRAVQDGSSSIRESALEVLARIDPAAAATATDMNTEEQSRKAKR